jgi:hypothetical protein
MVMPAAANVRISSQQTPSRSSQGSRVSSCHFERPILVDLAAARR